MGTTSRRKVLLAASTALVALGFGAVNSWTIPSMASAESGRRLCEYVGGVDTDVNVPKEGSPTESYTVPAKLYVAVDFKKDGACPQVEDPYHIGGGDKLIRLSNRQPVPKHVCEDWGRVIGRTGAYRGTLSDKDSRLPLFEGTNPLLADICSVLADDLIYEFYVFSADVTYPDGTKFSKGEFVTNRRYCVYHC